MPKVSRIRQRLTYANVMSTIAVVFAVGGATAFAAQQLGPNTVGTRQLKKNAVTSPKIKDGTVGGADIEGGAVSGSQLANGSVSSAKLLDASVITGKLADGSVSSAKLLDASVITGKLADGGVTTDKLADGGVTTSKLANGSVTAEKLAPGAIPPPPPIPGLPVVRRISGSSTLEFPRSTNPDQPIVYPLNNPTDTQPAGEDDLYLAAMQVHIPASCVQPRTAEARLFVDGNPATARAILEDNGAGEAALAVQFNAFPTGRGMATAAPAAATQHTFSVQLQNATCNGKGGIPSGITVTGVQVHVIGFR